MNLSRFTVVITKSTVPVGTADHVERITKEINPTADMVVASNPEFPREGAASGGDRPLVVIATYANLNGPSANH